MAANEINRTFFKEICVDVAIQSFYYLSVKWVVFH